MIGVIADDFTGATDVAVAFRRPGLRTVILFGKPGDDTVLPDADAVVIGLKVRTVPVADAVVATRTALDWLRGHGADRIYFKFCSTFDSRPDGNIGPVADALADALHVPVVAVVPSTPEHCRTQYQGHLFVGTTLLSDSPMRHHPLTPMTDSFIPRVLAPQTTHQVGLLDHATVRAGTAVVRDGLEQLGADGVRYAVIDAVSDDDLSTIGSAVTGYGLVAGAAGLAAGLARALAESGVTIGRDPASADSDTVDPVGPGRAVALAGSCSARTLEQVDHMRRFEPAFRLDAVATPDPERLAADALTWTDVQEPTAVPLIYSSIPPDELRRTQLALGADRASALLEDAMGFIARGLVRRGVRRIVVAGGETSASVVSAIGIDGGVIGHEAAPGVPWIYTFDVEPLALLLKSGNFGDPELLVRAVRTGEPQATA